MPTGMCLHLYELGRDENRSAGTQSCPVLHLDPLTHTKCVIKEEEFHDGIHGEKLGISQALVSIA